MDRGTLRSVMVLPNTSSLIEPGETPFSLTFGAEAVIHAEESVSSPCYQWLEEESNKQLINHIIDTIDELREHHLTRLVVHHQKMAMHFNKNVMCRTFKE